MRERAVLYGHLDDRLAGLFDGLADSLGHVVGLAESETHMTLVVAHNGEGRKGEAAAALDDLRGSVELDELLGEIVTRLRVVSSVPVSFHEKPPRM
ncbi:hypothetical protein TRIP_E110100 [uncultured Spirochaetota bacterium]|nr:hypothetical protein TRIP_E110100 [uncultured Spirochaetota bacterium]